MKAKATTVLLICGSFVVLWGGAICLAAEPPKAIKTDFAAGANLLPSELKQVVALAKQSGLADVAEVSTSPILPVGGKLIYVKSAERVDGRNISFESVCVHKMGWDVLEPAKNGVKRDGNFWVNADDKRTTLLRSYEFNRHAVRVQIGSGVDIAFADKVIPLIALEIIRAGKERGDLRFEDAAKVKPTAIHKGRFKDEYELQCFGPSLLSVKFRFENGQVVITSVSSILI